MGNSSNITKESQANIEKLAKQMKEHAKNLQNIEKKDL